MEMMRAVASTNYPGGPANYDEVSMLQSILFSDSLKDLKNLREQLYSAAEYFESSYINDDQNDKAVDTLKEYAIESLVKTVDHLGSITYKVNDLLNEQVDDVLETKLRVKCIEQRVRTSQEHINCGGLFQQSLAMDTPKYHKRYILPVGETMRGAFRTKSKYQGCSLDEIDEWHQYKNAIQDMLRGPPPSIVSKECPPLASPGRVHQRKKVTFSSKLPNRDSEWRPSTPNRYPPSYFGAIRPTTPRFSHPSPTNPTRRAITPDPALIRQQCVSKLRKPDSMLVRSGKGGPSSEQLHSRSKNLFRGLLSKYRMKKENTVHKLLDED